jgi:arginyl-tRNA--protein-N-Asp/Glu arginylyltransferase
MKKLDFRRPGLSFREDIICPYISDGRTASIEFFFPPQGIASDFHAFLAGGYRRLGNVLYRNVCRGCSSCKPLRIETETFAPSRSQKRTLKKNSDLRLEMGAPCVTPQKIALYKRYIASKHSSEKGDGREDDAATLSMLHYGYPGSIEMDYYLGEVLIGVGIVDEAADALSAVYFYYDTGYSRRSPGTLSILREIACARLLKKRYYYLGFYVKETPKMSYKGLFRPNQIYEDGSWTAFRTHEKRGGSS